MTTAMLITLLYFTKGPVPALLPFSECRVTWLAYRDVVVVWKPGYETAAHHLATVTCGDEVREYDVWQDQGRVDVKPRRGE